MERASRASLRGGTVPRAIRARRERGALEADRLVRVGQEVGRGLHAVEVRIEDGRDRHHHALLEELRRSRGHVRYYKVLSRRLRASAFAQRRARRGVRDEHATGRTHIQTARVRGCWGTRGACWGDTYLRIGMRCGGALVGCGTCSSRGVMGTVQMRSSGSVRSVTPARRIVTRAFERVACCRKSGGSGLLEKSPAISENLKASLIWQLQALHRFKDQHIDVR